MVNIVGSWQKGKGSKQVRGKRKKSRGPSRGARGVDQPIDEGVIFNPHLKAAILEVVENQIRNSVPPETRQTLERLLAARYSGKQAIEMIGSVLVEEIWAILHHTDSEESQQILALARVGTHPLS